jgi:Pyrimidine dimer DNA glycosylase
MQTFLPFANFRESAKSLDMKRLGKQRVEVLQLLNSFHKPDYKGWKNHPCREMWRGHENALALYGMVICEVWKERGYKDTCYEKIRVYYDESKDTTFPWWLGMLDVHLTHQSMLIKKYPDYYKQQFPDAPEGLEYIWPSSNPNTFQVLTSK